MNTKMTEKTGLKKWLENLQQESWQLELLISGFVIFGLFELKNSLEQQLILFNANYYIEQLIGINFFILVVFYLVVNIFIVNLVAHIIIRGLWIGAIGLRFVSGEIDYNELNYNDVFIDFYKKVVGSFDDYILRLEKFASIIFSFTFLLFFIFFSFMLFVVEIKVIEIFLNRIIDTNFTKSSFWRLIRLFIFFLSFLVAFDFITLGLLKKVKQAHFAKFYFLIYKVISNMTLSFLWRPLLLNFLDRKETKRMLLFIAPYMFIIIVVLPSSKVSEFGFFPSISSTAAYPNEQVFLNIINKHSYNKVFYGLNDNSWTKNGKENISQFSIPSYKLESELFEVFIKYNIETEKYISQYDSSIVPISSIGYSLNLFGLSEALELPSPQEYEQNLIAIKKAIKSSMQLLIDDQAIDKELIDCNFFIHPNAGEKGMLCFFPITIKNGKHQLEYRKLIRAKSETPKIDTISFSIPFIFDK